MTQSLKSPFRIAIEEIEELCVPIAANPSNIPKFVMEPPIKPANCRHLELFMYSEVVGHDCAERVVFSYPGTKENWAATLSIAYARLIAKVESSHRGEPKEIE